MQYFLILEMGEYWQSKGFPISRKQWLGEPRPVRVYDPFSCKLIPTAILKSDFLKQV